MSNRVRHIILILLVSLFSLSCTSRVVYEEQTSVLASPNAININTATTEELDKLPHIGRKTAEAIVQFRIDNGPFRRVEHLMQIRGISEKRFLELQPFLKAE